MDAKYFIEKIRQDLDIDFFAGVPDSLLKPLCNTLWENCSREHNFFVCADEGGAVLGHCFCAFQQHVSHNILTDVKTLYIDDLCVDEAHRGKHIGQTLYSAVLAFARENHCYNVTLNVWAGNDSALEFYRKQGLKPQKYGLETILAVEKAEPE